jgi:nucleotide-binding universal stress UspA family protein
MFNKILVPLDSSDLAEQALGPAIKLGQQSQGEITMLHVLERHTIIIPDGPEIMGQSLSYIESDKEQEENAAQEYLNGLKDEIRRAYSELTWKSRLVEGDPASCIVDLAESEKVELIVMSTHGYSGFTRWLLGSVTEKVLRHVSCPVLVVRDDRPLRRVLITLDGSLLAESSLPLGFDVAQAIGAEVHLLLVDEKSENIDRHMVEALNKDELGLGERYRQAFHDQAKNYLNRLRLTHGRDNLKTQTAVCLGKPAPTILNYAEENEIDLIVMSTHGRTGLARWRYGSVTEKVLHGANCALMIYRPEEMNE